MSEQYYDLDGEIQIYEYKVINTTKEFKNYSFSTISEEEIKYMFPKYYYSEIVNNSSSEYVYVDDKNILVSGKSLIYYYDHEKRFEIINDEYDGFLRAKVYNELIVAIAYDKSLEVEDDSKIPYSIKGTDILFYDLNGELIGRYKDNLYSYDVLFADNKMIFGDLYVDGICDIEDNTYYAANTNCKATLLNDIYELSEEFLGMAMSTKEEVKNPETLPNISFMIIVCFIVSIAITFILFVKDNFKKKNFQ